MSESKSWLAPVDQVEVTEGDGIETAGINGVACAHGVSSSNRRCEPQGG